MAEMLRNVVDCSVGDLSEIIISYAFHRQISYARISGFSIHKYALVLENKHKPRQVTQVRASHSLDGRHRHRDKCTAAEGATMQR
ncbi:hypothetical protein CYMTET_11942 [Cymbomonas tetramitiformis]|uniref:Uncharacterized protein n=1 Tax=Cymbomonas tetramitiformis TaxID=36881 RepID=A0AAE0GL33_9CHLO|nr:hypothetical protein CYMTET_11942 [Cymbomonas tetramitiformis]